MILLKLLHYLGYSHPWLAGQLFYKLARLASKQDISKALYDDVPTHMFENEKLALYWSARHLNRDSTVVEIGSYLGASACYLAGGLAAGAGGRVICVDTWQNDAMNEPQKDTFSLFTKNTLGLKGYIVPLRGKSSEMAREYEYGPIDLLFIDGDHSYTGCHTDWETWSPFLRRKCLVAFHDYTREEGIRQVVDREVPLTHRIGIRISFSSLCILSLAKRDKPGERLNMGIL